LAASFADPLASPPCRGGPQRPPQPRNPF
jgi:hypothetical protein